MTEIYYDCQHCGCTVYSEDVEDGKDGFQRIYDQDCGCEEQRLQAEEDAHYDDMMNND